VCVQYEERQKNQRGEILSIFVSFPKEKEKQRRLPFPLKIISLIQIFLLLYYKRNNSNSGVDCAFLSMALKKKKDFSAFLWMTSTTKGFLY
jgi:hypothetical protein